MRPIFENDMRLAELVPFNEALSCELLSPSTKLPSGVLVVKTTTIQLSSEPMPIPVYFVSLRELAYCDWVKLERTRVGVRLGTQAGNMAPSLVTVTFKWHFDRTFG